MVKHCENNNENLKSNNYNGDNNNEDNLIYLEIQLDS